MRYVYFTLWIAGISLVVWIVAYLYFPISVFDIKTFGSTITTLAGSDTLSASRSVINTNFSNLNSDKIETSNIDTCAEIAPLGTLETGTCGSVVFSTSPAITTPTLTSPAFAGTATGLLTVAFASTTGITASSYGNFATVLGVASTTPAFRFGVGAAGADFYIDSIGKVVALDTTNSWSGRLSPTRAFALTTGTTTVWAATTTGAYVPYLTMPFAGTLRTVSCTASSTQAFLGVSPLINTTVTTPSYFVASSTEGIMKFTGSNTFSLGDVIGMLVGTTTTDISAKSISCTFTVTETP